MTKWRALLRVWGMMVLLAILGSAALAQDPSAPADDPADEPVAAAEPQDEVERKKMPFGLYVGMAYGMGSSDTFNTSLFANELAGGVSSLELDEQTYGRAAVGWKLPHGKGSFRLKFQGVKEEEYEFRSEGSLNVVQKVGTDQREPTDEDAEFRLVPWWFIDLTNGRLNSRLVTPTWNEDDDLEEEGEVGFGKPTYNPNCTTIAEGVVRCGEVVYDLSAPDRELSAQVPDDLQNRVNTYDVMYGREFGGRRYSSRWWGGLRYFEYEGQLLAAAWLNLDKIPLHFTDGGFLRLLNITQKASGIGPMGSWEMQFNFFDKGLQLFLRGEAAFTFNSLDMDSGDFFQIENADDGLLQEDRLIKSLDKSSWQNRAEAGVRINLRNGLHVEAAYSKSGYLDIILMPDLLQIGISNRDPQTFTQDMIVDAFHIGGGFQF